MLVIHLLTRLKDIYRVLLPLRLLLRESERKWYSLSRQIVQKTESLCPFANLETYKTLLVQVACAKYLLWYIAIFSYEKNNLIVKSKQNA